MRAAGARLKTSLGRARSRGFTNCSLSWTHNSSTAHRKQSVLELLQGPLIDALTHTGQLMLLRRLAEAPVAGKNFRKADICAGRTGPEASPKTEL